MRQAACSVRGLTKSFGRNHVLRGIDLDLPGGDVTVLMGANGAGKSTLVKVLCGAHPQDRGRMALAGQDYAPEDAADAIAQGVVTLHQNIDDGVIPDLDVATNLTLDRLTRPGAPVFVRDRRMRADAGRLAESMGLTMDVRTRVADLGVADRQMIAIARAMARAPRVLILDEPTSALSASEASRLFELIDRLKAQGVAILYISHRMSDIRRIADRIVCMRDGAISGRFERAPLDYEGAVAAMLGRRMAEVEIAPRAPRAPVFEAEGLRLAANGPEIDMSAGEGEIVAITGLLGCGKTRLAEILFGLRRPAAGTMRIDGRPYAPRTAREAIARQVFLSPKDRGANAVVPDFDIADNMTLPFLGAFSRAAFIDGRRQRRTSARMIERLGIVCQGGSDGIGTLSGGNQQKVMIGRWLIEPARLLLLDEPFQGVDIGARRDIGSHIRATADGRATIVFVAEIDEALEIADRILVMHEGAVVGAHLNRGIDLQSLVAQVSGDAAARGAEA